ncbi:hypothetical protein C475_00555 [Halosimplex carlsbadense 2-9-1]|uniref:Uncharacterized protein n=2 Tax=Halosimplex carlsbadense TaxID=171164 RepID=M0D7D7_9EURY|nr:hypothetical protein C475_00555 [Halosimplex carlsbadense 2-9-1]
MEDAIAGTVFALSAAVTAGIASITILGHALSGSIWTIGGSGTGSGTEITIAFGLSLLSLLGAYATNRMDAGGKDMEIDTDLKALAKGQATIESYVMIGTILLVIGSGLNILGLGDTIASEPAFGIVSLGVQAAGYYVISYLG